MEIQHPMDGAERTIQDLDRQTNGLRKKIFYQKDPSRPGEIRTIRYHFNPFANKLTPMYSNWHSAEPEKGMEQWNPRLHSALMRFQHATNSFY